MASAVEYMYENGMHLDYSQLYMHPRSLKKLPNNQWYVIIGQKGTLDLGHEAAEFYPLEGERSRDIVPQGLKGKKENAMAEFYSGIREGRPPFASVEIAATAALTTIMGREAIYRKHMVTWKELGVAV
jgi:myo-inositol 2-dehydrogenase / D-chiro-inositol 1-dehydrogenase